jgi:hypothetical protein
VKWGRPTNLFLIPEKVGIVQLDVAWTNQAGHTMYTRRVHRADSEQDLIRIAAA